MFYFFIDFFICSFYKCFNIVAVFFGYRSFISRFSKYIFFCFWFTCLVFKICFKFDSSIKTIYIANKFPFVEIFCIGAKFKSSFKSLYTSLLKVFVLKLIAFPVGSNWCPIASSIVLRSWIKFSWFLPGSVLLGVSRCFLTSHWSLQRLHFHFLDSVVVDCSFLSDRCLWFLWLYFALFWTSLFLLQVHLFFVVYHG